MIPEAKYFDGQYFAAPRDFEGETAVCIASGPSLSDADVQYVRDMKAAGKCRIFVCNNNYLKVPEADVLFFCDQTFWLWHCMKPEFQDFKGTKVTCSMEIGQPDIKVMKIGRTEGLCFHPDMLSTGGNSGYMQVNLAFHYGIKRVILLGYEMQPLIVKKDDGTEEEKIHWFGDHPQKTPSNFFHQVKGHFETMVPDLESHGLEVINCSVPSAIECFPKVALRAALK